jgi:hypothetical protein
VGGERRGFLILGGGGQRVGAGDKPFLVVPHGHRGLGLCAQARAGNAVTPRDPRKEDSSGA